MLNNTEYVKGGNKGAIMEGTNGYFTAVTATTSKNFKTLKGAERFMTKMCYTKA